jgi:hypothetical protein
VIYAITIIPGQDGTFVTAGGTNTTAGQVPEFTRLGVRLSASTGFDGLVELRRRGW